MPRKDPNKPKGPTSAYSFYLQFKTQEAKEAGEKVDFAAFSQECSARWKEMNDDDKSDYFQQAEKDKIRYQKEMESYVPPAEDGDGGRKRGRKGGPKRAMSAHMLFISAKRKEFKEENPNASSSELIKLLDDAWNALETDARKQFEVQAKEDQERYREDKEAYERREFREDEGNASEEEESDED